MFQLCHWTHGSMINDFNSTFIGYLKSINHVTYALDDENKLNTSITHMDNTNFATIGASTLSMNELKENYYSDIETMNSLDVRRKREVRNDVPLSRWEQILIREKIMREKNDDDNNDGNHDSKHDDDQDDDDDDDNDDTTTTEPPDTTVPTETPKPKTKPKIKKRRRRTKDRRPRYYINRLYKLMAYLQQRGSGHLTQKYLLLCYLLCASSFRSLSASSLQVIYVYFYEVHS